MSIYITRCTGLPYRNSSWALTKQSTGHLKLHEESNTIYILSSLPGSGKSTLAKELAKSIGATYLRIDTIEQAIKDLCNFKVADEGYRLSYRVASENLKLGHSVIADSCNPIELTRKEWNEVAINVSASFVNIEVIHSDKAEHREQIEKRASDVEGLELPVPADEEWEEDRLGDLFPKLSKAYDY